MRVLRIQPTLMTVAIIPARLGSKSIPKKNIKLLGEKPLIAYSIESAQSAGLRTIVSTEAQEIAQVAKQYGAEVLDRPGKLAKDNTSMFDVLRHEVFRIKPVPEYVVLLQPTNPFRKDIHLKLAARVIEDGKYDSVITVEKVPEKYNAALQITTNSKGRRMFFSKGNFFNKWENHFPEGVPVSQRITRRQDHPECWIPDGSVYAFKSENLRKGSIYGENIMLLENEGSLNINDPSDWEQGEEYANQIAQRGDTV